MEEPEAGVPYDNRAFRYGYGLFETMLVRDGIIQLAAYHWERLFAGAKVLYFDMPKLMTAAYLTEEVLRIVKKNGLEKLCRIRLQLYGGNGGILEQQTPKPGYIIECYAIHEETTQLNEAGLVLGLADDIVKAIDSLANFKTTNALVYAIAAQQAKAHKWNDALVHNNHGNIIESTIANIFWLKDGQLYTPPLSEGCVAGVMRRYIMERIPVTESILDTDTLYVADEVFLTNAIRRIKWVSVIVDKTYSNTLTRKLYSQLFA
jgi:branched-chain amino acid aminotransferase